MWRGMSMVRSAPFGYPPRPAQVWNYLGMRLRNLPVTNDMKPNYWQPRMPNFLKAMWKPIRMAWNDPQWGNQGGGNKNSGGPPDLDELWKNFNRRLNDMFGKKGGNGGNEPQIGQVVIHGFVQDECWL